MLYEVITGEMDAEYSVYGWSTQNIPQALYWSGIYALHCGLHLWNLPSEICQGDAYFDVIDFLTGVITSYSIHYTKLYELSLLPVLKATRTSGMRSATMGD